MVRGRSLRDNKCAHCEEVIFKTRIHGWYHQSTGSISCYPDVTSSTSAEPKRIHRYTKG